MTAGRPAEAREVAGLVAELRALGVCWKRIERLLGWRLSRRTLRKMVAEFERGEPGISSPREACAFAPDAAQSAVASTGAASPGAPGPEAYHAAPVEHGERT